ncbi:MAG: CHRD domain-containing protein, partial [Burkholderiales bacterium]|nr:CHRD domain-containing protein [Burkholderiales bacterium]
LERTVGRDDGGAHSLLHGHTGCRHGRRGRHAGHLAELSHRAERGQTGFIPSFAGGNPDNAEQALIAGFNAGTAYFNIHTDTFPAGEIRGFLQQQAQSVPEPASWMLLAPALALALTAGGRRRRSGIAA